MMSMSVLASILITSLMLLMFTNLLEINSKTKDKKTMFECGYDSISSKKMTFSTNFFLISMMFLVFDMEISFLLPTLASNKMKSTIMMTCLIFILALTLILMKEWKQGSLEWSK